MSSNRTYVAVMAILLGMPACELPSSATPGVRADGRAEGYPPPLPRASDFDANTCRDVSALKQARDATAPDARACDGAYAFVRRCGADQPEASPLAAAVCANALAVQMSATVEKLRSSVGKSDVGAPPPAEIWPRVNISGALAGHYQLLGPTLDGQRMFVVLLARVEDLKPIDPRSVAVLKEAQTLRSDTIAFEREMDRLGPSCEAIDAFERGASTAREVTAARYRLLAKAERDKQVRVRHRVITERVKKEYSLGEVNLAVVRKDIAEMRALPGEVKCFDAEAASAVGREVETRATALESAVVDEEKCRATPVCMQRRELEAAAEARTRATIGGGGGGGAAVSGGSGCTCRDGTPGCCGRGCCSHHGGVAR